MLLLSTLCMCSLLITAFTLPVNPSHNDALNANHVTKIDRPLAAESRSFSRSAAPDEEIYEPAAPYLFTYDIADNDNNKQFRKESSDGNAIRGSYGYTDANGLYRVVEYIADAKHGFRAKVKSNEPGMDNVEFGESENVPSHRRYNNNNFKFDNLNLDDVGPADHESMSSNPSGASIWPANVYMEVSQPPAQIWQYNPNNFRSNRLLTAHSETDSHIHAESSPQSSAKVLAPSINRRTTVPVNNFEYQNQNHGHHFEESGTSMTGRSVNEPLVNPHAINLKSDTIVTLPDQNKRMLKQLLQSSRRPVEAESQRIQLIQSVPNGKSNPAADQPAQVSNRPNAQSSNVVNGAKNKNQELKWPFATTSFGSKIEHKVVAVVANSTNVSNNDKHADTANASKSIQFDDLEKRNQN